MKLHLLSAALFVAATSFVTATQNHEDPFKGAPTKSTPVVHDGITYGHFVTLMESGNAHNRNLQGFANDPSACRIDGVRFSCTSPSTFSTTDGNVTDVTATIDCALDDAIGLDFQESSDCRCQALFDQREADRQRNCACSVCPKDGGQAVALNCTVVPEDPFILGPCTSIDCFGRCNGTGPVVVNLPQPPPQDTEAPTPTPGSSATIAVTRGLFAFAGLFAFLLA